MKELEQAKVDGFHDITFVNDDLHTTYEALEKYIFDFDIKDEPAGEDSKEPSQSGDAEIEMTDEASGEKDPKINGDTSSEETTIVVKVDDTIK